MGAPAGHPRPDKYGYRKRHQRPGLAGSLGERGQQGHCRHRTLPPAERIELHLSYRQARTDQPANGSDRCVGQVPHRQDHQPEHATGIGTCQLDHLRPGNHQSDQHGSEPGGEQYRRTPHPGPHSSPRPVRGCAQRRGYQPAWACQSHCGGGPGDQRATHSGLPRIHEHPVRNGHHRKHRAQHAVCGSNHCDHPPGVCGVVKSGTACHHRRAPGDEGTKQQGRQQGQDAQWGPSDDHRDVMRSQPPDRCRTGDARR